MHHQFAEGAEDHEREEAAHRVADDQGRAGRGQAAAGAQEEPGADGAADGDHLDLPGFEALVVALILGVEGGFGGMGMRRNGVVGDGLFLGGCSWAGCFWALAVSG